jgi:PAN domain
MISCDKPITTLSVTAIAGGTAAELCAQKCSADPRCQGFNFRFSDKGCFHHTIYQNRKFELYSDDLAELNPLTFHLQPLWGMKQDL